MTFSQKQLRVAAPILAVTAALSVALYFLLSWQPNREARRGFESKTGSLANILAQGLVAAMEFEDPAAAERSLVAARVDPTLVYITARKLDGKVLASVNGGQVANLPELLQKELQRRDEGELHHVAVPIFQNDKPLGWLQAGFSLVEVEQSYAGTRLTSFIVAALAALAGLVTAFLMGRSTANRLGLLSEIATTSSKLRSASEHISAACSEQGASTSEQAAAIDETRHTMTSLLEAAKKIADTSQEVFRNADQTSQTTLSISDSIKQLTHQAQKISDISEVIRSISDKSDLLALNASLEGTKAGEAGRGFALVAAEMRRLAESVMAAAREIKQLTSNIRGATDVSVKAAEEGRSLAEKTSESAREITLVTVQQRNATEQVTRSMDEVSQLLTRSATSTKATESAAQTLSQLADQLGQLTSRFAAEGVTSRPRP